MRIRDTLSGELKDVEFENPVKLYYCGLTVSDSPHLGHARGWIHVDVLRRLLEYKGYNVQHIENITDVNEKIFNRLVEDDIGAETEQELADRFSSEVLQSMEMLNLKRATAYPRVSNHIDEIIDYIQVLIDEGYAYESNESVYFDVGKFRDYGKLSNQSLEDMESQGSPDELEEKRSEHDFALWKAVKPEKTRGKTWQSPWGQGRPGWHIECSVMSQTHLDLPIDIHIGGQDLVFPHHENEIAQSEAVSGKFAENWMHIRLLKSGEDSEKMSSSRNNFRTVSSAVDEYGSNTVRWFLLSSNYDNEQKYTDDMLEEAKQEWIKVKKTYSMLVESLYTSDSDATVTHSKAREEFEGYEEKIVTALSDNLNTRESLSYVREVESFVRRYMSSNDTYDQKFVQMVISFYEDVIENLLGFTFDDSENVDVADKISEYRDKLRSNEEYESADIVRDALRYAGYEIEDTEDGTVVVRQD